MEDPLATVFRLCLYSQSSAAREDGEVVLMEHVLRVLGECGVKEEEKGKHTKCDH